MTKMLEEILEQPVALSGIEKENESTLKALAAEINDKKIKTAVFSGRGTSDHASIYGQYLFGIKNGIVSSLAIPSCITSYDCEFAFENMLVIGVSQSGKAADALAVLNQAKNKDAVTVAITNDKNSPMALSAKYHLYCNTGAEISVAATKTFTAQMYLIALLSAYISGDNEFLSDLRTVPDSAKELIGNADLIREQVVRYRFMNEGFVLARGICYPVALETALKIQETCYIKMKGYAISDFYHGPMAQLDSDVPVIIYAVKGHTFDDAKDMIKKVCSIGISPLVVTDDGEFAKEFDFSFVIPSAGSEFTKPYLLAIFAQLFAECLCGNKGMNPDAPRLLKKVTITK